METAHGGQNAGNCHTFVIAFVGKKRPSGGPRRDIGLETKWRKQARRKGRMGEGRKMRQGKRKEYRRSAKKIGLQSSR